MEMEGIVDAQHQFPVVITGKGACGGRTELEWTRLLNSRGGKTTIKNAHHLTDIAESMQKQVMLGDTQVILPYYGTAICPEKREKRYKNLAEVQPSGGVSGLYGCRVQ